MATKPQPLRVFLSYSHNDRRFAGALKRKLEAFRFSVFVAHDDVNPSDDFVACILEELRHSDIVMPLLTKSFHRSHWTDQECGFALNLDKLILPVSKGVNPYGFLRNRHAYIVKKGKSLDAVLAELLSSLTHQKKVANKFRDSLILAVRTSSGFPKSIAIFNLLAKLTPFSRRQMKLLLKYSIAQDQVYRSTEASKLLNQIVRRNPRTTDKELVRQFMKRRGYGGYAA
jgi:hypothetical protein